MAILWINPLIDGLAPMHRGAAEVAAPEVGKASGKQSYPCLGFSLLPLLKYVMYPCSMHVFYV